MIRRRRAPLWGALAGLALAVALGASGCRRAETDTGEVQARVPVRVSRAEMRTVQPEVAAAGQWRAADSVVVIAPFAAYVEALRPRPGDHIARGETIGDLVTRESRSALLGAEILAQRASGAAERDEAERALAQARRGLVRVPLVATAAGTVIRRTAEPGSEVTEGATLLTTVPEGSVVFEAHVPRAMVVFVQPGQRATVQMEGADLVPAAVQRRLPESSGSDQTALVWLSPSRVPNGALERFGKATILTGAAHRAVAVPDSALVEDDLTGEVRVARVAGEIAIWTPVRLGQESGGWHELLAPALPPGTLVVVSGHRGLPDSTRVEIGP
ncbi:MAG TPA: HlyD family efflux transporter periplasmic adaptor subunit [Candidatus Limnocylindrales bacterium]|nr:HlyD family efflux transporter periplasmic adaptor subunit [Candidatus Limnocylindrales bacterium]